MALIDDNADANAVAFTYPFLTGIDPHSPPPTLSIPTKYLDAMANMERQYWEIKSKHYNLLIFFKKGKFYELYDYDAVIANREFGLKMVFDTTNRGKMRLAGVPEQSLREWARLFVFRGYKVGRVEQMKENESDPGAAKAKVVPRELIEVLTPGTLKDPAMLSDHGALFVLALVPMADKNELTVDGFAVDLSRRVALRCNSSSSVIALSTGRDSNALANSCKPEKDTSQPLRDSVLRAVSALLQQLNPKEVVMPDAAWLEQVFGRGSPLTKASDEVANWVEGEGYTVERIPYTAPSSGVAGATEAEKVMASYFTSLCLNSDIVLFSEATNYAAHLTAQNTNSMEASTTTGTQDGAYSKRDSMADYERRFDRGLILDATTVSNLEILTNLHDGSEKHTLNDCLNHCGTNGGRRLFRSWLLRPSSSARVVTARQEAARFLAQHQLTQLLPTEDNEERVGAKRSRSGESHGAFSSVVSIDFERFLSRLSDMKQTDEQHIAYVDPMVQYKKNLGIILSCVRALLSMVEWVKQFRSRCEQVAAEQLMAVPVLLEEHLASIVAAERSTQNIEALFDRQSAEESGMLIPSPGTSAAYDAATASLAGIEDKLSEVRRQLQYDVFGGAKVNFSDLGKDLFLLEVAAADAPKVTPPGMVERARSSRSIKYVVTAIANLVEAHKEATAAKSGALLSVLRSVATRICDEFPCLFTACSALSYVDCLLNLAQLHLAFPTTCYPTIVTEANDASPNCTALVCGSDLVHPLLAAKNPVPNTVALDSEHGRVLLLTGPNMAGKSTLMRTVAINVLMAQLGGPVLATQMELCPVDRIFTRIGARDASHKGQSTLYVELSETADMLHSATARSLCLVDELGRGTSTHDGMAIAYATLHALTATKPAAPLTIFSTHYHALAMEQERLNTAASTQTVARTVQLGYMDFMLRADPSAAGVANLMLPSTGAAMLEASDDTSRSCPPVSALSSVVFLYRLVRGICERSYGVEVALMAGIPTSLVQLAKRKSQALSRDTAFHEDIRDLERLLRL